MDIIVSVKNLKKRFGKVEALKDVTFDVKKGEVVGFIGPNGAGKSTTIRVLLGNIKKDGGSAEIFGSDVWKDRYEIHKNISYVPGDVNLWGNLTGGEIIDLLIKLQGSGRQDKKKDLIEKFDLDIRKKAKTYSKGNRQKVALIAALSVDAKLYIFDEPTSGLDPLMERVFQREVLDLKSEGKTILLSSHILSEVEHLADRIVIIRNGEIVEIGTLSELRHLTRSKVTIDTDSDLDNFKDINGVHDFKNIEGRYEFSIDDDRLSEIISRISPLNIKKLEITPPNLEDLFMTHYENK